MLNSEGVLHNGTLEKWIGHGVFIDLVTKKWGHRLKDDLSVEFATS